MDNNGGALQHNITHTCARSVRDALFHG
jgi:hypothetical protein